MKENYNISLTEAKNSKEYKYTIKPKEEIEKLINSLKTNKSMNELKEDVYAVLEFGNIDIELNVLNSNGLVDIGYITCKRFLNENNEVEWETHGYTDNIKTFDISDFSNLEEVMFNTLMRYADKYILKYSEPN